MTNYVLYFLRFFDGLNSHLLIPLIPFITRYLGLPDIFIGILLSSYGLGVFLSAPIIGTLSDKYGQKKFLLISFIGSSTSWVLILYLFKYKIEFGILVPFIIIFSRLIDGMSGSSLNIVNSIIGKEKDNDKRRKMFSTSSASYATGYTISPIFGANLISETNYFIYGFTGLTICLIAFIVSFIFITDLSNTNLIKRLNLNLFSIFKNLFYDEWVLIWIRQLLLCSNKLFFSISSLHLIIGFNLSAKSVGLYFSFMAILRIIFNLMNNKISSKIPDTSILKFGIYLLIISNIGLAFSSNIYFYLIFSILLSIANSSSFPITLNISSEKVSKDRIGMFMGSDHSFGSLLQIIFPLVSVYLYQYIGSYCFLLVALIIFLMKKYLYIKLI